VFQLAANHLGNLKPGPLEAKPLLHQVKWTLQRRERGFSRHLRRTISRVMERTEKCRRQMRRIWECIIQRQIKQLNRLARALKSNERDILDEYRQLCQVYPNNTYVASAFAAFLSDIICNEKEAETYSRLYKELRGGASIRVEGTYEHATKNIPTLPTAEEHAAINQSGEPRTSRARSSMASESAVDGMVSNGDVSDEASQKRHIELMVSSVRLPVMRYGPVLLAFSVAILMPVIVCTLLAVTVGRARQDLKYLQVCEPVGRLTVNMMHVPLVVLQTMLSSLGLTTTLREKMELFHMHDAMQNVEVSTDQALSAKIISDVVRSYWDMLGQFRELPSFRRNENLVMRALIALCDMEDYLNASTGISGTMSIRQAILFFTGIAVPLL
jgi:hypothetical protein